MCQCECVRVCVRVRVCPSECVSVSVCVREGESLLACLFGVCVCVSEYE